MNTEVGKRHTDSPVGQLPTTSVTKSTLEDLQFAESYLEYVARQKNPETRARAKVLLATIAMLDARHPVWRQDLLIELARRGIERDTSNLFPLPEVDTDRMYKEFMDNILTNRT